MALYWLCFALMLTGPVLGFSPSGMELALWAYASALALAISLDLLKLMGAKLRAPWEDRPFFGLIHFLALMTTLPLLYFTLFKQRPIYEITLAVCLLLWLTSLVGCLGRPKSNMEANHG